MVDSLKSLTLNEQKEALAKSFIKALKEHDWDLLRSIITDSVTWELPGNNLLSGKTVGIEAVLSLAKQIVSFGVSLELEHILIGNNGFALAIHNRAERNGYVLDEHLATVCIIQEEKIAKINTYLSDIDGMDSFFVPDNKTTL